MEIRVSGNHVMRGLGVRWSQRKYSLKFELLKVPIDTKICNDMHNYIALDELDQWKIYNVKCAGKFDQ